MATSVCFTLRGKPFLARFFLFFIFTGLFYCYNSKAQNNTTPARRDSLKIWDSLVNRNIVINNQLARHYAFLSLQYAMKTNDKKGMALAYYNLGRVYLKNDPTQGYSYFSSAFKIAKSDKPNLLYPKILYHLALINNKVYNNKDALNFLDTCINTAINTEDYATLSMGLSLKGVIALEVTDSSKARQLFDSAYKIADKHHCDFQKGAVLANLTVLENDPLKVIRMNQQALKLISRTPGSEEECASMLVNIGLAYQNRDSSFKYNNAALLYAEKYSLRTIQIAAYNNLAYLYLENKQFDEAINSIAKHAIPIAKDANDHDWLASLYDTYAEILVLYGDYKHAAELQKMAYNEKKYADQQFSSKQIRLLSSILDLKQKDLEITNHKKTILIQRSKLSQLRSGSAIVILVLLITIGLILLVFQKARINFQRKQIESAHRLLGMEEEDKNRIAMELHDSLGPFFQSMILSIENIEQFTTDIRQGLIGRLREFKQTIRSISHRMNNRVLSQYTFEESISELTELYHATGKGEVVLSITGESGLINGEIKLHVYRIIQELLTNAQKYATRGPVYLTISMNARGMNIYYLDKGPGFDSGSVKGMGVSNIYRRLLLLNGKAVLETSPGSQTSWEISIPFKPDYEKAIYN